LILETSQVQIWRSQFNIPSCISKNKFVRVRILILISKIISDPFRSGWSNLEDVNELRFESIMSKYFYESIGGWFILGIENRNKKL
jgi:hypothetical protein